MIESYGKLSKDTFKVRKTPFESLDSELHEWFYIQTSKGLPISGSVLQVISKELAQKYALECEFSGSSSWITRFKQRHSLVNYVVSGESKSADSVAASKWLTEEWPSTRQGYEDKTIFNGDEKGLFYKMLPNRILKVKDEKFIGR